MNEKESFSQFVQSFTQLSFAARISGNLKIGLLQFLAELVPHYNLIKYVMDSKRQNHEYLRNMEIYWPDNIDALNNANTRSEYNKVKCYLSQKDIKLPDLILFHFENVTSKNILMMRNAKFAKPFYVTINHY